MRRLLFIISLILIGLVSFSQIKAAVVNDDSLLAKNDSLILLDSINDSLVNTDTTTQNSSNNVLKPLDPVYDFLSTRKILWAVVILILAFFGIRIGVQILVFFAEKSITYRFTIKGLIPLFRIIAWSAVIIFIIAGIFSPDYATIIAFSASIGVAVGFAAQDILKNIFGGIMIIFDQPFKVGDKIEIGNYYGEVLEIGLRSTRIVTADDSIVSVPNSEIMNQSVSNSNSGEPNCQVVAEFFLPMDIDTEQVRKIAIEGAQVSRYVYLEKPVVALFFQEIKDRKSYLKMRLKAYVLDIRYEFAFKSDMTELVLQALLNEGIIKPEDYA
jgi:small-conductance mechanosensitive channel